METKELLPIGSIVLLKEGTKKLMVFGVRQTDEQSGREYDYVGVVYPEGNLGNDTWFLFDHENIAEVIFRGYEDEERTAFVGRLSAYYEARESEVMESETMDSEAKEPDAN